MFVKWYSGYQVSNFPTLHSVLRPTTISSDHDSQLDKQIWYPLFSYSAMQITHSLIIVQHLCINVSQWIICILQNWVMGVVVGGWGGGQAAMKHPAWNDLYTTRVLLRFMFHDWRYVINAFLSISIAYKLNDIRTTFRELERALCMWNVVRVNATWQENICLPDAILSMHHHVVHDTISVSNTLHMFPVISNNFALCNFTTD